VTPLVAITTIATIVSATSTIIVDGELKAPDFEVCVHCAAALIQKLLGHGAQNSCAVAAVVVHFAISVHKFLAAIDHKVVATSCLSDGEGCGERNEEGRELH